MRKTGEKYEQRGYNEEIKGETKMEKKVKGSITEILQIVIYNIKIKYI